MPPSKPLTRKSILDGCSNLKKELSILSPLKHTHVIQLYGVMLRPLGKGGREGEERERGGGGRGRGERGGEGERRMREGEREREEAEGKEKEV